SRHPPPIPSTLSLHDALPICSRMKPIHFFMLSYCFRITSVSPYIRYMVQGMITSASAHAAAEWSPSFIILSSPDFPISTSGMTRSEEHTSELQSRFDLVCRLL